MYINWAHFYIPKVNGALSFFINPLFIYIVLNEKHLTLGNYRYLLLYFSLFNMASSLADILVPVVVHDFRFAFSIFIGDGPFETYSPLHQAILGVRCSFISGTYAILHSHFIYRYMILFKSRLLTRYFLPYGILLSLLYLLFHITFWMLACLFLVGAEEERREYLRDTLHDTYNLSSFDINLLVCLYQEGSEDVVQRSFISLISLTVLSVFSVALYFILGVLTLRMLNSQSLAMSQSTKRLQRQLMKALTVQSVIPTVVSFAPCVVTWYLPLVGMDPGRWARDISVIAISTFPFLDPLAILSFIPTFRRRVHEICRALVPGKRRAIPTTVSYDDNVFTQVSQLTIS